MALYLILACLAVAQTLTFLQVFRLRRDLAVLPASQKPVRLPVNIHREPRIIIHTEADECRMERENAKAAPIG